MECILPFGMLCFSVWRMMFVKMVFAVRMSGWWMNVRESSLGVCSELCVLIVVIMLFASGWVVVCL